MGRMAALALTVASMFLMVMAILVNSAPLFYMCTAIIATLLASRLQAWLSVRALRFERYAPNAVSVGDKVQVELTIWSERRIKRPLVTVHDGLPKGLVMRELTPSLPVAPSYDQPIRTFYSFRPMRRGVYRWSKLTVSGTDALGMITLERTYETDPVELTVYPAPLPVAVEIQPLSGWGASDVESSNTKGPGLEVRGLREYSLGDPLRYVHWASSARLGRLMVKEFDASSASLMLMALQRNKGSEVGLGDTSTLEAMCGHALFLGTKYTKQGANVVFPVHEALEVRWANTDERLRAIREILTLLQADGDQTLGQDLAMIERQVPPGSTVVLFVAVRDGDLPDRIRAIRDSQVICLVYDAEAYVEPGARQKSPPSAADPLFLAQLEDAGARVVFMPKVERVLP